VLLHFTFGISLVFESHGPDRSVIDEYVVYCIMVLKGAKELAGASEQGKIRCGYMGAPAGHLGGGYPSTAIQAMESVCRELRGTGWVWAKLNPYLRCLIDRVTQAGCES